MLHIVKQKVKLVRVPEQEHDRSLLFPDTVPYTLVLEKHTIGPSHHVARAFGSRRVLEVIVPEALLRAEVQSIQQFFWRCFVLNGRVFQAVCAVGSSVFLVETGDYPHSPRSVLTNNGRKSLQRILAWQNSFKSDPSQVRSLILVVTGFDSPY